MSDENEEIAMAECGSCRAIVPVDSKECPECGISFSGVSDEALGECGACNALVPLDSTKCPECGVVFVADDVIDILRTWMANNKMDVKTLFGRFDTNNDNMIDSGELKGGLLSLNLADLPPSQVDKLVAAIDEDGDSLIDLEELQTIIGGESLADTDESSETEEDEDTSAPLEYNENVLSKVMESNDINDSDKDAFIEFAKDFNEDGNSYLKKEELQAAAAAWNERSMDDES
ncbi:MAG: EF-hand domain-containing protein, partial [Candidatus Thermoplasmatota archaeon]|nr:EF-hand domain-containing protein [Candidatus Thermoplasmatota archaeon]